MYYCWFDRSQCFLVHGEPLHMKIEKTDAEKGLNFSVEHFHVKALKQRKFKLCTKELGDNK